MKSYYVGLSIRKHTLVIEARTCKDFLGCELYDYMGERCVTKKQLFDNRYDILSKMQTRRPDVYGKLRFAIVE